MNAPATTPEMWTTVRVALKWCCRTRHRRWKAIGEAVLNRGFEETGSLEAGVQAINVHTNRANRVVMEQCLAEDPARFWDMVYKYWRSRGPHDGISRETIDLDKVAKFDD